MFSLQAMFGKGDKFFDLLESSAKEARASVQALVKILQDPNTTPSLSDFALARRKDKRITEEISEHLCNTFATGMEREDIESLSHVLYKIPKTVEKFAERFIIARHHLTGMDFSKHIPLLDEATATVETMVKDLRQKMNLEQMATHNARLQHLEGQADELILKLLEDLYSGRHDPIRALVLKDLFELLEKVLDRCREQATSPLISFSRTLNLPRMTLILCVVLVALIFEYVNGFHDTANAVATSVSTKVMSPRTAITLAAVFNLLGALAGTSVAKTPARGGRRAPSAPRGSRTTNGSGLRLRGWRATGPRTGAVASSTTSRRSGRW